MYGYNFKKLLYQQISIWVFKRSSVFDFLLYTLFSFTPNPSIQFFMCLYSLLLFHNIYIFYSGKLETYLPQLFTSFYLVWGFQIKHTYLKILIQHPHMKRLFLTLSIALKLLLFLFYSCIIHHCIYCHILIIYLSIDGYLGCFYFLAIKNRATNCG